MGMEFCHTKFTPKGSPTLWEIKINGFNKETKLFLFFFYVKPRAVTLHDKGDRSKEIL